MARKSSADLKMLVSRIGVEDGVNRLAGWYGSLDSIEEVDELLICALIILL